MAIQTRDIAFEADGSSLVGHFAVNGAILGRRPGILVFDEATGLGDHARRTACWLAGMGFAVLAADYCRDGIPTGAQAGEWIALLTTDPMRARARAEAALSALVAQPETDARYLAAIGFCLGGTIALELARHGASLRAVIGFHCGLATQRPARRGDSAARILVCLGAADPLIGAEERASFVMEMEEAGIDWSMLLTGGAAHSFTNRAADSHGIAGVAFHARASADSWTAAVGLLGDTLF